MTTRRIVHRFGDVNASVYGGGVVFRCEDGSYDIEYTHGTESDGDRATVYRESIPNGDLVEYYNWADLDEMSKSLDVSVAELRRIGKPKSSVRDRADFIGLIGMYYGWHELDQYPINLSEDEIDKRWMVE